MAPPRARASGTSNPGATRGASERGAAIASATSSSASRLWPLTSASQCGRAATRPPARAANATRADARVDPHDPVGQPAQPLHLASDQRRVAPLPAVGQDHDDRAARHAAPAVAVIERLERVADPGAARPVGRGRRGALDRALGIARAERARQAGQAGGEHERLGVRRRRRRRRSGTGGTRGRRAPSSPRCRTASRSAGGRSAGAAGPAGSGRRRCAGCPGASGACRSARRGGRAGPAGAPHRGRDPHAAVISRYSLPARPARARRSASREAPPRRSASAGTGASPSVPLGLVARPQMRVAMSVPTRGATLRAGRERAIGAAPGIPRVSAGAVCASSDNDGSSSRRPPPTRTRRRTPTSNAAHLRAVGDKRGARRPVQPPRG